MDADNHVILRLQNLSKIYHMGDNVLRALDHVNLEIYAGEFLIVIGPSGSGKSTLLNIIGGTDQPTEGEMFFLDKNLTRASESQLTLYRRNEIGFIFQFYNLLPTLTALENVEVMAEISKHPKNPMDMLNLVGLKDYADHFPAQLSGGQQQRVAIARALVGDPRLLLCDEPTGALDSKMSQHILDLLLKLCRTLNKTIVFITHNPELAKLGDRIIVIKDGRIQDVKTHQEEYV